MSRMERPANSLFRASFGCTDSCPAAGRPMKTLPALVAAALLHAIPIMAADAPITLVIHGGAGIARKDLSPEKEAACRKVLEEALRTGHKVLREGGSSLDAVQACIIVLEDSPVLHA